MTGTGWIKCADRLPPLHKEERPYITEYLSAQVLFWGPSEGLCLGIHYIDGRGWEGWHSDNADYALSLVDVTHWIPAPEVPKEE